MVENALISIERIQRKILLARGQKVMLDQDIAELYGVKTGQLTRQVRRNIERFPSDFMFQLNKEEYAALRSQTGNSWHHCRLERSARSDLSRTRK